MTTCKSQITDEFGMDPQLIELLRPFFEFLYFVYFRVSTKGLGSLPKKGPAILVANHSGTLPYDGIMINLAVYNENKIRRNVRFLVENFAVDFPLLGNFIRRSGGVRASQENATKLLGKGELIVVFPEGVKGISKTYDDRYKLQRFGRGGYVRLAMRTRVPIVPVAVIGAEEIHPIIWKSKNLVKHLGVPFFPFTPTFPWLGPLGLVPLPSKWQIVFGKPVHFSKYAPEDSENEKLVNQISDRIKNSVQRMIQDSLKKRKSIWI